MDVSKDSVKPAADDKAGRNGVSGEKEPKAPVKEPVAGVSAMAAAASTSGAKDAAEASKTDRPQVRDSVGVGVSRSSQSAASREGLARQTTPKKEEPTLAASLEKLEDKITRNLDQFKKVDAKIRQTEEEIAAIEEKKSGKSFTDKVKGMALYCPKVCVEANVCRFPKAVCKGCRKMVDAWKSAGKSGAKVLGELAGKCADSLSAGVQLPVLRMKINKDFRKLGDRAYQMYLEGDKDILKDELVKGIMDEVKGYEKQIEKLEAHLTDLDEQLVAQKQTA